MKRLALQAMQTARVFAAFRWLNSRRLLILTYHRFSENEHPRRVSRQQLAAHLEFLTQHYRVLPLGEIVERIRTSAALPEKTVALTIDDGYRDAYEIAFPVLQQFNAPATLFVITDFLDRKAWLWTDKTRYLAANTKLSTIESRIGEQTFRFELNGRDSRLDAAAQLNGKLKRLPDAEKERQFENLESAFQVALPKLPPAEFAAIDWTAAQKMDKANVKIESHTVTHPILTNIDETRLHFELHQSRRRVSEVLEKTVDLFCYPNGNYNEAVRRAVEATGYQAAVTTELGFNTARSNLYELCRVDAHPQMLDFLQNTSGFETAKNRVRSLLG